MDLPNTYSTNLRQRKRRGARAGNPRYSTRGQELSGPPLYKN